MTRRCWRCGRFARLKTVTVWFHSRTYWLHGATHHALSTTP